MSELTRDQLALAIARVRNAHAVPLAKYETSADDLAAELIAELAEVTGIVDAHICCEHAGTGDGELLAMAALMPALPMVSRLGHDARERVMDWARRRATDGLPPF